MGLSFKKIGYFHRAGDPEPPAFDAPTPKSKEPAARWLNWREPPAELVQVSQGIGSAWLRRQGLQDLSPASEILAALAQAIESARVPGSHFGPKARKAFLAEIGGVWGQLVHRDCAWQWIELPVSSRTWRLGLAPPKGSHALCLDQVIERQLAPNSPSTLKLMYNMIRAGNLPPGEPGDHVVIG